MNLWILIFKKNTKGTDIGEFSFYMDSLEVGN